MNYEKLMNQNPTELGSITNSKGQLITFYEHPILGDEAEVICVCHDMRVASYSGFFELDDMMAEHGEYEPWFDMNEYRVGDL
jgi:hypothetical protein